MAKAATKTNTSVQKPVIRDKYQDYSKDDLIRLLLVDFGLTALSDAWQMHNAIHGQLAALGIDLMPLMLVQVGNSDKAVDEARQRLHAIGVPFVESYRTLCIIPDQGMQHVFQAMRGQSIGFDA